MAARDVKLGRRRGQSAAGPFGPALSIAGNAIPLCGQAWAWHVSFLDLETSETSFRSPVRVSFRPPSHGIVVETRRLAESIRTVRDTGRSASADRSALLRQDGHALTAALSQPRARDPHQDMQPPVHWCFPLRSTVLYFAALCLLFWGRTTTRRPSDGPLRAPCFSPRSALPLCPPSSHCTQYTPRGDFLFQSTYPPRRTPLRPPCHLEIQSSQSRRGQYAVIRTSYVLYSHSLRHPGLQGGRRPVAWPAGGAVT